jgi:rhodanese-related sulfurtransferase
MFVAVRNIDVSTCRRLQAEGGARLVDVRTDAEVAQGMIEGALHIPLHLLPLKADELSDGVPTVFYCRTGARSAQACAFLASRGPAADVYNLEGGIFGWVRAGMPLAAAV